MNGWVIIPNWPKFQHYSNRRPPWIKAYVDLLDREEYLELSPRARSLLHGVWLLYARFDGVLLVDRVASYLRLSYVRDSHWDELSDAGFLTIVASRPLAQSLASRYPSRAPARSREGEVERDTPNPTADAVGNSSKTTAARERGLNPRALGTNPRAVAKATLPERNAKRWIDNGLAAEVPQESLREVIADEFRIDNPQLLDELVEYAATKGDA